MLPLFLLGFGVIGGLIIIFTHAASLYFIEPETGTVSGNATKVLSASASGGSAVLFSASSSGFDPTMTLAPGATLPSDATCAARVTSAAEIRPQNATQNATAGHQNNLPGIKARVDGNFTGTTDEILQWTACKWGIDVNIVRAEAAKESYWTMSAKGDYGTDPSACPPAHGLGVDGTPGQCPQSYGILQVRYPFHGPPAGLNTWPDAETSTAYNADYMYSVWRECFEGQDGWLNTVDHTGSYAAGDQWGCVGVWFAGRWHTTDANTYIQAVQDYDNQKIWLDPGFIGYRGWLFVTMQKSRWVAAKLWHFTKKC